MEIPNKYEEVKVTLGYDIPLSKDTFSKEKASEFLSYTIGGDKLELDEVRTEARKTIQALVEDIKVMLLEGGEEIKLSIEELKNTRNPEIDKVRVELDKEYAPKLAKAKEIILKQREEIKLLKEK